MFYFIFINLDHKSIQEGIIYLLKWIACVSFFAVFDIFLAKISLSWAFLFCRCHKPPPQIVGEEYAFFNLFTCVVILLLPKKGGGEEGVTRVAGSSLLLQSWESPQHPF